MLAPHHWDPPPALEDSGGWLDRDTSYRFGAYAVLVAERLGDRVHTWITLEEAVVCATSGHGMGTHHEPDARGGPDQPHRPLRPRHDPDGCGVGQTLSDRSGKRNVYVISASVVMAVAALMLAPVTAAPIVTGSMGHTGRYLLTAVSTLLSAVLVTRIRSVP